MAFDVLVLGVARSEAHVAFDVRVALVALDVVIGVARSEAHVAFDVRVALVALDVGVVIAEPVPLDVRVVVPDALAQMALDVLVLIPETAAGVLLTTETPP
jgi:hypothetical protein